MPVAPLLAYNKPVVGSRLLENILLLVNPFPSNAVLLVKPVAPEALILVALDESLYLYDLSLSNSFSKPREGP